jgi:PTS system galactitol-specific IIC component
VDQIIGFANAVFTPIINMGAAPMMVIILTVIACCFKVKFSEALMGGLKLGIAITGISAVIGLLTTAFSDAMTKFVASTGIQLTITDLGWAPLATITWGSPYTLFFLLIMVLVDIVMIVLDRTNTIDVDVFDIWHLAFVGLACMYFGAPLWVATLLVVFIGVLKIMNSDVMRPTFNDLIDAPGNPMTTTHMNYMMNPIIMVFNKFFDRFLPGLDRYDFDAAKLNEKVGFWGSKFSIGIYLGIFVGLLAHEDIKSICTLAFTAAVCLELFSLIGAWFIEAIEPLSQGISNFANERLKGRTLNVGLDWPFLAGRAEIWAAANVLAPIMLLESLVLAGQRPAAPGRHHRHGSHACPARGHARQDAAHDHHRHHRAPRVPVGGHARRALRDADGHAGGRVPQWPCRGAAHLRHHHGGAGGEAPGVPAGQWLHQPAVPAVLRACPRSVPPALHVVPPRDAEAQRRGLRAGGHLHARPPGDRLVCRACRG